MKHGYSISGFVSHIGHVSDMDTLGYTADTYRIRSDTLLEYPVFLKCSDKFWIHSDTFWIRSGYVFVEYPVFFFFIPLVMSEAK